MNSEILSLLKEFKNDISNEFKAINDKLNNLEEDVKNLKLGQSEIKNLIIDIDPKNANRHVEIIDMINSLRKDLSTVEIVTANNYVDIAKL